MRSLVQDYPDPQEETESSEWIIEDQASSPSNALGPSSSPPEWKKFGSGMEKSRIRDKHPGSATLTTCRLTNFSP